jgi:lipid-A-disaccharide synthase
MQIKTASRLDVLGAQTPLTIAIVAGESSGDQLGSRLIENIVLSTSQSITFIGVGGPLMVQSGLQSLFPMSDIAVNGLIPVIKKLPTLLRRISQTARAIIEAKPACLVLIEESSATRANYWLCVPNGVGLAAGKGKENTTSFQ